MVERWDTDPLVAEMRLLRQSLDRKHPENVSHMQIIEDKIDRTDLKVDQVLKGFPAGDPDGHRRAHDAMIKNAERRAKFWESLSVHLAEKGIWGVLAFIGAAVYFYFINRAKQ